MLSRHGWVSQRGQSSFGSGMASVTEHQGSSKPSNFPETYFYHDQGLAGCKSTRLSVQKGKMPLKNGAGIL